MDSQLEQAILQGITEQEARMFAFVTLVIDNPGLIFANRSRTLSIVQSLRIPNKSLWRVSGGALFFLILLLTIPVLRGVFQFAPVHRWEMALLFIAGLSSILCAESVKLKPGQEIVHGEGDS